MQTFYSMSNVLTAEVAVVSELQLSVSQDINSSNNFTEIKQQVMKFRLINKYHI